MRILWNIFEMLINVFQASIALYFNYSYLKSKKNRPFLSTEGLLFIAILSLTILLMNKYLVYEGLYALIYSVIAFIYTMLFLQGSVLKKIFSSVYPMMVMLISTSLISNFMILLLDTTQSEMIGSTSLNKMVVILII